MTDFIGYLKSAADKLGDELDLSQLAAGDELKVVTSHTEYLFKIMENCFAIASCARFDRPAGRVRLMGCTLGNSSSIKPDHLFCGGNLEFTYHFDGRSMIHRTTAIKAIYLRRRSDSTAAATGD
jgi:hypothetical protein